jgi:hypothetical protein
MDYGTCVTSNEFNITTSIYYPVSSTVTCTPSLWNGYEITGLMIAVFVLAVWYTQKILRK